MYDLVKHLLNCGKPTKTSRPYQDMSLINLNTDFPDEKFNNIKAVRLGKFEHNKNRMVKETLGNET